MFKIINDDYKSYNDNSNVLWFYFKNPGFQCTTWYRICNCLYTKNSRFIIKIAHLIYRHKEIKYGIQIDYKTVIGKGFSIYHYNGIVINRNCIIGDNCSIRNNVTIGEKKGKAPKIGNNVFIGPNSCLIGDIGIGDNCIIGAGSVVVSSFEKNSIIGGNPAKLLKKHDTKSDI